MAENVMGTLKDYITLDEAALLKEATRWEMTHGGKSGRTAAQFIDHLAGGYDTDE